MVTLCHAVDDCEVLFLRALLESHEIPFFIVGEHFGSLYPGVQIASFNERRILVDENDLPEAAMIVQQHKQTYEPAFVNLTMQSKFRIVLETFLLGWCFPVGTKKAASKKVGTFRDFILVVDVPIRAQINKQTATSHP